jgi:hypothetical protein
MGVAALATVDDSVWYEGDPSALQGGNQNANGAEIARRRRMASALNRPDHRFVGELAARRTGQNRTGLELGAGGGV